MSVSLLKMFKMFKMFKMLNTGAVAAACVAMLACTALPASAQERESNRETERVERTVPLASGGTLKLKNFSGNVRITGADRQDVAIVAVRRAPRERLDRIKLSIEQSGNTVTIEANKRQDDDRNRNNNVVETEFDIQVPRRTELNVSVFSSAVRIEGVTSDSYDVHSFSGELVVRDVAGALKAKTFSGGIDVALADSRVAGTLDLDTFSGDIAVQMPRPIAARVTFNSFSGDLKSDYPLTLESKGRRNLTARLGEGQSGASDIRLKTFSGDARIRK